MITITVTKPDGTTTTTTTDKPLIALARKKIAEFKGYKVVVKEAPACQ